MPQTGVIRALSLLALRGASVEVAICAFLFVLLIEISNERRPDIFVIFIVVSDGRGTRCLVHPRVFYMAIRQENELPPALAGLGSDSKSISILQSGESVSSPWFRHRRFVSCKRVG
jgi:hypothetical protein